MNFLLKFLLQLFEKGLDPNMSLSSPPSLSVEAAFSWATLCSKPSRTKMPRAEDVPRRFQETSPRTGTKDPFRFKFDLAEKI